MSVLDTARSLLGRPYVFGGPMGRTSDDGGCDCSGFVSEVFKRNGIALPAFTDTIAAQTTLVSDPRPGDLVLYRYHDDSQPGTQYPHVDIFEGGNSAIGCYSGAGSAEHAIFSMPHEFRRVAGLDDNLGAAASPDVGSIFAGLSPTVLLAAAVAAFLLLSD